MVFAFDGREENGGCQIFGGGLSCVTGSNVKYESIHLRRLLCFSIALKDFEFFGDSVLSWLEFSLSLRSC